jgi:hypothetical protein
VPSITIGETLTGPNGETFKITAFVGKGAFGEVYRAVGNNSGVVVAVKLLAVSTLSSGNSRIALLNEVRAAQQVKHPNVVEVVHIDDGTTSSIGPFVFMEYVSGGTLATLLRIQLQSAKPLDIDRAIAMMIDIAKGTQAINEKLIHRDIKPDNILVEGGKLKISDFGISKFIDESTRLHTFKGGQHIAYMAPEGWRNQPNTFKLDVYSVGLVFYQILALKHPLASKVVDLGNFLDWETVHLYENCPDVRTFRNEVPVSISQLVSRMVNKRPSDRPDWDEVLAILTKPGTDEPADHPAVRAAVEAVIARREREQQEILKETQRQSEREKQVALYGYACEELIKQFEPAVEQFNRACQHGQIMKGRELESVLYRIPSGKNIAITFYEPRTTGLKIGAGEVIGGGWIGIDNGRSANLVLLKQGPDDLYGRWTVCEIGIMAVVDASKLIGRFGLTNETIVPFGFKDAYFYDQIRYATGITHAFTYNFIDNVTDFFAQLLLEASH